MSLSKEPGLPFERKLDKHRAVRSLALVPELAIGESDDAQQAIRRVLVATDLSDNALIAVQTGVVLSEDLGASLRALHCIPRLTSSPTPTHEVLDEKTDPPGPEELREVGRRLREHVGRVAGGVTASQVVRSGRPYALISEEAESFDADLVVVGAHTPRRYFDGLLGTTAERVLRTCRRPILLAQARQGPVLRRVLVATDFSPHADHALSFALRCARQVAARRSEPIPLQVVLLHVAAFTHPLYRPIDVSGPLRARAEAAGLDGSQVTVQPRLVSAATARDGILMVANEIDADLIVVGTHGLGLVMRALVGGVTLDVLRAATRIVVAVPPADS